MFPYKTLIEAAEIQILLQDYLGNILMSIKHSPKIAVVASDATCIPPAKALAKQLELDWLEDDKEDHYDFVLTVTPERIQLQNMHQPKWGPLVINFLSGALRQRLLKNTGRQELIARAVGWKSQEKLRVLDATAGLGRDGFLLATLGCEVTMLERSSVVAVLLQDGLQRALVDAAYKQLTIELQVTDAICYLQHLKPDTYPDVIYLDPMFPPQNKSALVKKEMQYLQALIGSDEDVAALFELALKCAKKRVVLKRPRLASIFNAIKPDIQFFGKDSRYDVYLIKFVNQ